MQISCVQLLIVCLIICISHAKLTRVEAKGSIFSAYKINLTIGDPKVTIPNLMLDTGSSLTLFPCRNCMKCRSFAQTKIYDPYVSFSSHNALCRNNLPVCDQRCPAGQRYCQFSVSYGEGSSLYGKIHQDTFYFNGDSYNSFKAYFGCNDVENEIHDTTDAAIMGLLPDPNENILYGWFQKHPEDQFTFSTCFQQEEGFFQIGVNPQDEKLTPAISTKFDSSATEQRFYVLKGIQQIRVGSTNIVEKVKTVFLDTGTSLMLIPQGPFLKIIHEMNNVCQRLGSCQVMLSPQNLLLVFFQSGSKSSSEYLNGGRGGGVGRAKFSRMNRASSEVSIFRPLQLTINGQTIEWKPEDCFLKASINNNGEEIPLYVYLISMKKNNHEGITLGNAFMQKVKIVTNLKEQTVKMYTDYDCKYTPTPSYAPVTFTQQVKDVYDTVRSIKTQYLVLGVLAHVAAVFLLWKYKKKIKSKWAQLKKKIKKQIKKLKRKKKKYRKRKPVQVSESFNSAVDSNNLQDQIKKKPTKYRRRGRKGHIVRQ